MGRIIFAIVVAGLILLLTIYSSDLTRWAITDVSTGWMTGFLTPRISVTICSLVLSILIASRLNFSKVVKWAVGILVFGIGIGGYLLVNLPYINDWMKYGVTLDSNDSLNPVEVYLEDSYSDFDGLVMFSLPGCPYCEDAIANLELVHRRAPERDLLILVFVEDSAALANYKNEFSSSDLTFEAVPEPKVSVSLNRGQFPGFFYVKNGRMIHRWFSGQFGYPAYDWVENGLN
jgi:glutaredoxin